MAWLAPGVRSGCGDQAEPGSLAACGTARATARRRARRGPRPPGAAGSQWPGCQGCAGRPGAWRPCCLPAAPASSRLCRGRRPHAAAPRPLPATRPGLLSSIQLHGSPCHGHLHTLIHPPPHTHTHPAGDPQAARQAQQCDGHAGSPAPRLYRGGVPHCRVRRAPGAAALLGGGQLQRHPQAGVHGQHGHRLRQHAPRAAPAHAQASRSAPPGRRPGHMCRPTQPAPGRRRPPPEHDGLSASLLHHRSSARPPPPPGCVHFAPQLLKPALEPTPTLLPHHCCAPAGRRPDLCPSPRRATSPDVYPCKATAQWLRAAPGITGGDPFGSPRSNLGTPFGPASPGRLG
jgi:hypothetical protein